MNDSLAEFRKTVDSSTMSFLVVRCFLPFV